MYKYIQDEGVLIRTTDNKQILPCQDYNDPEHIAYLEWFDQGGRPESVETRDPAAKAAEQLREYLKQERAKAVDSIIVTTESGKSFDGDETSQQRMSRAIQTLQIANQTSTSWVLSNNEVAEVSIQELAEALMLAGLEQSRIWMSYAS